MDKPAAIMASLVDARNVGTHKMLKLTAHVPEELALDFFRVFGWPTGTNPVPVAIARLTEEAAQQPPQAKPKGTGRPFHELPYATQTGIKCGDESFREYLGVDTVEDAAIAVRQRCGVSSRAHIETDEAAKIKWLNMLRDFERPYR